MLSIVYPALCLVQNTHPSLNQHSDRHNYQNARGLPNKILPLFTINLLTVDSFNHCILYFVPLTQRTRRKYAVTQNTNMRPLAVAALLATIAQGSTSPSCADFSPAPIPTSRLPSYFPRQKLTSATSLIDIEDIRQTVSEYAFIIDARAFDSLSDIFTTDAVANYSEPLGVLSGVETIKTTLSAALAQFPGTQHLLGSQRIRLCNTTTAISATYFRAAHFLNGTVGAVALLDDSTILTAYAQYQDSWVKSDGLWKIKYRNVVYMVSLGMIYARSCG